jgi:hypothetical protein
MTAKLMLSSTLLNDDLDWAGPLAWTVLCMLRRAHSPS